MFKYIADIAGLTNFSKGFVNPQNLYFYGFVYRFKTPNRPQRKALQTPSRGPDPDNLFLHYRIDSRR